MSFKKPLLSSLMIFLFCSCTQVDVNGLDPDLYSKAGDGGAGGDTSALCKDVESTFSTKVLPVFSSKCSGAACHTSTGAGGGLNLDDSDSTRGDGASGVIGNIIAEGDLNAFAAEQSALLLKPLAASEGGQSSAHTGGQIFANKSDENYKTLFCWINGGAKNDLDDSKCTFGQNVYPIFRKRGCVASACHDASTPAGNMNLSQGSVELLTGNGTATFSKATITPVVTGGDINSLILTKPAQQNAVTHGGGQVFSGTTDVDYQTIRCWVQEGAKNN